MRLSVSTQFTPTDDKAKFEAMLRSVAFADEVVVFLYDGADTAFIKSLARKFPLRLIPAGSPKIVENIRGRQIREAKGEWVLVMDFDEVVPQPLADEILMAVSGEPAVYAVNRRNFSLGYPLRFGGWGDDLVIRLFHKDQFLSWPTNIHSTPVFKGSLKKFRHRLEHHKDASLQYIVGKTNAYSDVEAKQFYAGGLPPVTSFTLIRKWWMETFRRGFLKLGILDGAIGIIQSLYQGFSVFISYAKLYEKQRTK